MLSRSGCPTATLPGPDRPPAASAGAPVAAPLDPAVIEALLEPRPTPATARSRRRARSSSTATCAWTSSRPSASTWTTPWPSTSSASWRSWPTASPSSGWSPTPATRRRCARRATTRASSSAGWWSTSSTATSSRWTATTSWGAPTTGAGPSPTRRCKRLYREREDPPLLPALRLDRHPLRAPGGLPLRRRHRAAWRAAGGTVDYVKLFDDIREHIDTVHRDGTLKALVMADLPRYLVKDPELGAALHKLRSGGKKLFLLTNSHGRLHRGGHAPRARRPPPRVPELAEVLRRHRHRRAEARLLLRAAPAPPAGARRAPGRRGHRPRARAAPPRAATSRGWRSCSGSAGSGSSTWATTSTATSSAPRRARSGAPAWWWRSWSGSSPG